MKREGEDLGSKVRRLELESIFCYLIGGQSMKKHFLWGSVSSSGEEDMLVIAWKFRREWNKIVYAKVLCNL